MRFLGGFTICLLPIVKVSCLNISLYSALDGALRSGGALLLIVGFPDVYFAYCVAVVHIY